MTEATQKKCCGISGSTLKMIAVITMLIDHVGAGVIGRYLSMYAMGMAPFALEYGTLWTIYRVMRNIGRIAFPIYCFLLVEGFMHTRSVKKYSLRLLLFAAVSEIPFDLLFSGKLMETQYQNVFFTLWIGVLVMCGMHWVEEKQNMQPIVRGLLCFLVVLAGMVAADFLATDYSYYGIFSIALLYDFRKNKKWQIAAGAISFLWEIWAVFAFIPIGFYNGKRGWNIKYFFYLFYPLHLLVLFGLCVLLGINGYPC